MHTVQQALDLILAQAKQFGTEEVDLAGAFNRILARDVYTDREYPPFNRSAMDGYAVCISDFTGEIGPTLQCIETVYAGCIAEKNLLKGTCIKIMTGAPVPEGANAVVRIEDTAQIGDAVTFHVAKISDFQNIARKGEDAHKGALLLNSGTLLNAAAIAALATTGHAKISVFKCPQVLVISTGSELVEVGSVVLPHQIRDSNSHTIINFLKQHQIFSIKYLLISDNKDSLKASLEAELHNDIIVLSGGVSKGDADYIPAILQECGVKEIFHKVKVKPGSPFWFGATDKGTIVFGLPGNPVAVHVACKLFIEPFLRRCFLRPPMQALYLPLLEKKKKKTRLDEYFPCRLINRNHNTALQPCRMNGSGDVTALMGSDGIALHPAHEEDLEENNSLAFYSWN